jgi:predicted molibdopterin-dependent oxidoreductase YjgC
VEDLALRADRAANVRGAELLGFVRSDSPLSALQNGDALLLADHELSPPDRPLAMKASAVVLVSTVLPSGLERADVVLPIANYVEEEGTFTNLRGRVQRFLQAKAPPGLARPSWYVLSDLCGALGESAQYFSASQVFRALAASHAAFGSLTYESLGFRGQLVTSAAASAEAIAR